MRKELILFVFLAGMVTRLSAQAPGSVSTYGGGATVKSITAGSTSADVSETLYIGPGIHIVNGTWEIYARRVVIDPTAIVSGSGTMVYYNPSAAGGIAGGTLIDGNAGAGTLDVNQQLMNASGMQLSEMTFPLTHVAAGWTDNTAASTVYIGRDLDLAVDGADVTMGTGVPGDLRLDDDATISNYRPERMVITNNSILSHMVKENYSGIFIFPLGIADGDYTPAQVRNAANTTVYAGVQDYTASASVEVTTDPGPGGIPADGMNRTWHIFGDAAGTGSIITLQHNSVTNQSGFNDASHFVTRWSATIPNTTGDFTIPFTSSAWQSNTSGSGVAGGLTTPSGTVAGSSQRGRSYGGLAVSGTAEESYFTKSADPFHPLPLYFLGQRAEAKDCNVILSWSVNAELPVQAYRVRRSTDGRNYVVIGQLAPSKGVTAYSYTDRSIPAGSSFYTIEMIFSDASSVRSSTMKVLPDCAAAYPVRVYPNPFSGRLYISGLEQGGYTFQISAADGKLIFQQQAEAPGNAPFVLEPGLPPGGNYLLHIISVTGSIYTLEIFSL